MVQNIDSVLHVKASEHIIDQISNDLKKSDGKNIQDLLDDQEKKESSTK